VSTSKESPKVSCSLLTGQSEHHISWLTEKVGIHSDVVIPWQALCNAAKQQGFELEIASGFRGFSRQLAIWNGKFSGELTTKNQAGNTVDINTLSVQEIIQAILTYSALPGASRHHWGTDIDIYAPNLLSNGQSLQLEPWEYQQGGPFEPLSLWLTKHATDFGFYFPYDKYRGGIAAEPWHLSYFPLAKSFQQQLQVSTIENCLTQCDILGKDVIISTLDDIYTQYITNVLSA